VEVITFRRSVTKPVPTEVLENASDRNGCLVDHRSVVGASVDVGVSAGVADSTGAGLGVSVPVPELVPAARVAAAALAAASAAAALSLASSAATNSPCSANVLDRRLVCLVALELVRSSLRQPA